MNKLVVCLVFKYNMAISTQISSVVVGIVRRATLQSSNDCGNHKEKTRMMLQLRVKRSMELKMGSGVFADFSTWGIDKSTTTDHAQECSGQPLWDSARHQRATRRGGDRDECRRRGVGDEVRRGLPHRGERLPEGHEDGQVPGYEAQAMRVV